ncbi:MAG: DJ-1/PfpI family protein [Planctomycetes bacterium]|nr:DJ-1/PfpI family protein [Planctomycetota bacterium]
MSKKVLLILAEGFEEIEAITIIDILRRAGVNLCVHSLEPGLVSGAHGLQVQSEGDIHQNSYDDYDAVVLPGGLPGSDNLLASERVGELVKEFNAQAKLVAAVCAAPMVLGAHGLLEGKKATCYPGFEEKLLGATCVEDKVVLVDNVLTSRGPGTTADFAYEIVKILVSEKTAQELSQGMLFA